VQIAIDASDLLLLMIEQNDGVYSTQERVLAAAAELFARHGYNGVSTRAIASKARVNEITIYRYYARKRELYRAVLESELKKIHLRKDLLSGLASAGSGATALGRALEVIAATMGQEPDLMRLLQFSALEFGDELKPLLRKHLDELVDAVAAYLEPWTQTGELKCEPQELVLTLAIVVLSHQSLRKVFPGDIAERVALDAYVDFCRGPMASN
jgi:AcrR family transcriptional regulator